MLLTFDNPIIALTSINNRLSLGTTTRISSIQCSSSLVVKNGPGGRCTHYLSENTSKFNLSQFIAADDNLIIAIIICYKYTELLVLQAKYKSK
jgi:hypothetical protein